MGSKVVVVGGGLAGLVAAVSCARAGCAVTLLEAAPQPGGRGSTDDVGGFRFDRGAHALFLGGAAERTLAALGVVLPGQRAPTPGSVVVVDGVVHPLIDGPLALAKAGWLGLGGRAALARFLWAVASPARHPTSGNAAEWLGEVADPRVRALVRALTRVSTYCGDLDRLDARLAAHQLSVSLQHGVFYVDGGWQTMVDALAAAARNAGVAVHPGEPARSVGPDLRVETERGVHPADHVVLAVPPDRAEALLGRALPPRPGPAKVGALQLAIREEALAGGPRRLVLRDDPPVFVSDFSSVVPMGPAGVHVLHAIRYGASDQARAEIEATLDQVWPRWRSGVVAERWLPAMVTAPSVPEPGRPRLPITAAGTPGLWLAGDAYGPEGHLADTAFASARACAEGIGG